MNTQNNAELYVKVTDAAGDELVCPLAAVTEGGRIREAAEESCVEQEVIGRYAGRLKLVDAVA
jgi:hypothetical protein